MGKNRKNNRRNNNKNFSPYPKFRKQINTEKAKEHQSNGKANEYKFRNSLREDQVGITEFITRNEGFTAVVKARFSDFIVNEIDLNGQVVKLTDTKAPVRENIGLKNEEYEKAKKELESIITADVWKEIQEIANGDSKDGVNSVDIDVTSLDKEKRTLVHKVVKHEFKSKIISSTETVDDMKIVKIFKFKGKDQRITWTWPGEYVHFVLHKENIDTVQAASYVANGLRMKTSLVNYAGTKDKRAKTTQRLCVKKREPEHILKSINFYPQLQVGNFEFKDTVLKLGDLKGNRFRIALRHVSGKDELIEESLQSLKNNGFINYFGLQRFGTCASVPTYEIGIALLKSDYKKAVELILKPRPDDLFFLRDIRETWWKNRNSAEAAAMFRSNKFIEKKLLDGLAKHGENDYATALRKIPRNMLLLYPHSYQSLVWNKMASRRIKEFGLKLIPGDLVYREANGETEEASKTSEVPETKEEAIVEGEVEGGEGEGEGDVEDEAEAEQIQESVYKQKVQALTAEDISSGKYTIFDVVLPMPGYDITYPSNEVGKWYEEILAEEGFTSEKLKHNVKLFALGGTYRKLIMQPGDMKWEFKRYDSPTCTLIASDYEEMQGLPADEDKPDGKLKALLLYFDLPLSGYATMLLRELLKSDTSTSNQIKTEQEEMQKHENKLNEEGEANKLETEEPDKETNTNGKNIDDSVVEDDQTGNKRKIEDTPEQAEDNTKKLKQE